MGSSDGDMASGNGDSGAGEMIAVQQKHGGGECCPPVRRINLVDTWRWAGTREAIGLGYSDIKGKETERSKQNGPNAGEHEDSLWESK